MHFVVCAGELRLRGCRVQVCVAICRSPFANAKQSWTARSGVIIELWDEDGVVGIGEASPLPGHSRSTLSDCQAALDRSGRECRLGCGRLASGSVAGWTPKLALRLKRRYVILLLARSARCLLLQRFWGTLACADSGNAVISTIEEAHAAVQRGITTLKIKVGSMVPLDQESQKRQTKSFFPEAARETGSG